jgi:hypothetical protein
MSKECDNETVHFGSVESLARSLTDEESFDMNPFLNSALITYPAFVEGREAEVLALSAALRRNWFYVIRRMFSVPIEGGR